MERQGAGLEQSVVDNGTTARTNAPRAVQEVAAEALSSCFTAPSLMTTREDASEVTLARYSAEIRDEEDRETVGTSSDMLLRRCVVFCCFTL